MAERCEECGLPSGFHVEKCTKVEVKDAPKTKIERLKFVTDTLINEAGIAGYREAINDVYSRIVDRWSLGRWNSEVLHVFPTFFAILQEPWADHYRDSEDKLEAFKESIVDRLSVKPG